MLIYSIDLFKDALRAFSESPLMFFMAAAALDLASVMSEMSITFLTTVLLEGLLEEIRLLD